MNEDQKLTSHFYLSEFLTSETAARLGLDNRPSLSALASLNFVARRLEEIRALLGHKAIVVTSGFRSPPINCLTGGVMTRASLEALADHSDETVRLHALARIKQGKVHAADSQHMLGEAVDFRCNGFGTPYYIAKKLEQYGAGLQFDQLIHEFGGWVHVSFSVKSARRQVLTYRRREGVVERLQGVHPT